MAEPKKCAHSSCNCKVDKEKFCSQVCKDAKGMIDLTCHCGHAGCDEHVKTN